MTITTGKKGYENKLINIFYFLTAISINPNMSMMNTTNTATVITIMNIIQTTDMSQTNGDQPSPVQCNVIVIYHLV